MGHFARVEGEVEEQNVFKGLYSPNSRAKSSSPGVWTIYLLLLGVDLKIRTLSTLLNLNRFGFKI